MSIIKTILTSDSISEAVRNKAGELLTDVIERYPENDYEDVNVTADRRALVGLIKIDSVVVDERGHNLIMTEAMIDGNNDREYIEALVSDLKNSENFIDPIVVFLGNEGRFIWTDGQHRITAAHKAGYEMIEAIVVLP
jgi:hypothetical protein